jgi:hypothetical protein
MQGSGDDPLTFLKAAYLPLALSAYSFVVVFSILLTAVLCLGFASMVMEKRAQGSEFGNDCCPVSR